MTALTKSDRFVAWKRDSWASANQPHCWKARHIFQLLAPFNHYSWISANGPTCTTAQSISERFAHWYIISDYQQNDDVPEQHYLYLNVSIPENAIPENRQIDHIAGRNNPYVNVSKPQNTIPINKSRSLNDCTAHFWSFRCLKSRFLSISKSTLLMDSTAHISSFGTLKTLFVNISKSTLLHDATAIIWTFRDLKMPFLQTSNRPTWSSTLIIYECFAAWKQNSWISA